MEKAVPDLPIGSKREVLDAESIKVARAPEKPAEQPPIIKSQQQIDDILAVLETNIDQLIERISPILSPETEGTSITNAEVELASPLARKQAEWRDRIATNAQRIKIVVNRLEL